MQPLKAADALVGAVRMLREFAKEDEIRVDFIDRSGDAEVLASEKALNQILLNLGSNAVKFSPTRSIVSVLLQRRAEYLELIVRDNGVGNRPTSFVSSASPFSRRIRGQPAGPAAVSASRSSKGLPSASVANSRSRAPSA